MSPRDLWMPLSTASVLMVLATLLLLARDEVFRSDLAFWSLNLLIIASISYQIIKSRSRSTKPSLVLAQILLYPFVLRIAYTPAVGLFGLDPFYEVAVAQEIALGGWSLSAPIPEYLAHQFPYPMVHIMGLALAAITNTDLIFQASWISNLWTLTTVLWVFVITRKIYGSDRAGLLAAFGFATLHSFVIYHSLFHRETYAIVSMGGAIFALTAYVKSRDARYVALMMLFMVSIVLGHNLASFMLLLFVSLVLIASLFLAYLRPSSTSDSTEPLPRPDGRPLTRSRNAHYVNTTILAATMVFGYWVYLERTPIRILLITLQGLFEPGYSSSFIAGLPATVRYSVLTLGILVLGLSFGIVAVYLVWSRRKRASELESGLLLWGAFSGVLAMASFASLTQINILPDKLEYYGYFALFILVGGVMARRRQKGRRLIALVVILVIASAIFSVYRMPPYLYSAAELDAGAGDIRAYTLTQEYAAIAWIPEGSEVLTDAWTGRLLAPLRGIEVPRGFSEDPDDYPLQQGMLLVSSRERVPIAPATLQEQAGSPHVSRVYDNGVVSAYVVGPQV